MGLLAAPHELAAQVAMRRLSSTCWAVDVPVPHAFLQPVLLRQHASQPVANDDDPAEGQPASAEDEHASAGGTVLFSDRRAAV